MWTRPSADFYGKISAKDLEVRRLRDEVANLERVQNILDLCPAGSSDLLAQESPRSRVPKIPDMFFQELLEACDKLKSVVARKRGMVAERERLQKLLSSNTEKTLQLQNELKQHQDAAHWKKCSNRSYASPIALNDEITSLRTEVASLMDQRETLKKDLDRRTATIESLVNDLKGYDGNERKQFDCKTETRVLEDQQKSVDDEVKSLQRILDHKELVLAKLKKEDNAVELRSLEGRKRCNQCTLTRHNEHMRANENVVRNNTVTMQQLENKLELIARALMGDEERNDEAVDADAFDALQKKNDALFNQILSDNAKMEELDQAIELLESEVHTIAHATECVKRRKQDVIATHKSKVAALNYVFERASAQAEQRIGECKEECGSLKSASTSRQRQRSPQPK